MVKKRIWVVFIICIIISLIPAFERKDEAVAKEQKSKPIYYTTSRGAVEYNEPIYEAPKPYIDTENYTITWADEEGCNVKITNEEFKLLCHTVFCESGNQTEEAQVKVARVILFRMLDDRFPNTLSEVIYQGGGTQFNVVRWKGFPNAYPYTGTTEIACFRAICECPTEPFDMLAFRSGYAFKWGIAMAHTPSDGDMYFTRLKKE